MSLQPVPKNNIGIDYLTGIYANASMETKEPQPLYILHRDTIKSFLYEKAGALGALGTFLGLLGIEVTIILTLCTAEFKDFWIFTKENIRGTFNAFSVLILLAIVVMLIKYGKRMFVSVDKLSDELGNKGSVIKPNGNKEEPK